MNKINTLPSVYRVGGWDCVHTDIKWGFSAGSW